MSSFYGAGGSNSDSIDERINNAVNGLDAADVATAVVDATDSTKVGIYAVKEENGVISQGAKIIDVDAAGTAAQVKTALEGGDADTAESKTIAGAKKYADSLIEESLVDLSNYVTTSDSRLSNARPASDVYAWAKAASKPSYSASEIGAAPASHTHTKDQVGLGNVVNLDQSKAIKSITRSGTTFTATALDGTTTTFTQQDSSTTYSVATSSADGLMSAADKTKLDGIDPSAITTNAANIKKNADEIAKLNSAVAEYRLMIDPDTSVLSALEKQIAKGYALKRNGRLFATKIWRFSNDSTSLGERLRDSVGLTCEPSTDTAVRQDDFATASPIFTYQRCNYIRDEDGTARVIALEGSPAYRTEGAYDVGNVYPTFYWNCEHHGTYDIYYMSDTPHPELGLVPWCEAVKADGTVLPIYTHSAFAAGKGSDGLPRSQPGLVPMWASYNSMITEFQKKGSGYWGAGSERNLWGMLMLIIKYATKNVQKIFAGHTQTLNMMEMIAHAETSTKRVLITNNNMGFFDGMCVSVGSAKNQDPSMTTSYDIVNRAKVTGIENVKIDGKSYTAINLDVDKTFDTAETYCVKCYPSIAGETDRVIGHLDGSYLSNTDGKHPLRILGTEFMWGQAMIESNAMSEKDASGDWLQYFAPKGVNHVANAHTGYICAGKIPGASFDYSIGDIDVDTRGFMWPSAKGTSDSLGTGDRVWGPQSGSAGNLQERYTVGSLWYGSGAGFASVAVRYGLSPVAWSCGCCD